MTPGAAAAGTARAADAVGVARVVGGRIEVDHVRDLDEVEPAGGELGRDQRRDVAGAEALERPLAARLRHVAVHRRGGNVALREPPREPIGAALRPDEDEREPVGVGSRWSTRTSSLSSAVTGTNVWSTTRRLGARLAAARPRSGTGSRVHPGQIAHLAVERRREEHRLARTGKPANDRVDLRLEAHVEHSVGFVEDEDLGLLEGDKAAIDEILQAAGRGDEDLGAFRLPGLADEGRAAVDGGDPQARGAAGAFNCSATWAASSRVGTSTSAEGVARPRVDALDER